MYGPKIDNLLGLFLENDIKFIDTVSLDIIDKEFIEEIRNLPEDISLSFGRSLREFKCTVQDYESQRVHEIFLKYNGLHKLTISRVNLPHSQLQECEYSSIEEVVLAFRQYINSLSLYFQELESIDTSFTVMEPVKPTFKDDYRRILLDERTWLHVEVTSNGSAMNIHLVGQSEHWHDKLQAGLLAWDHDKDIVSNITDIFDLMKSSSFVKQLDKVEATNDNKVDFPSCAICFCVELPDNPGVPQPVCQNPNCGVYFHKSCLFQWLVACERGRLPAFGVANGSCPTCLQSITCSEKDN
ncbi:E3 ubiquitin-protein ligase FANCL [Vanessa tameamea]|uniref:E3 ubiquitin-protein ligase FANCL n=1 Tax=Vanessa tameamea TaxID=334116 RepID=A0A8B8HPQ3_VANTA